MNSFITQTFIEQLKQKEVVLMEIIMKQDENEHTQFQITLFQIFENSKKKIIYKGRLDNEFNSGG